MEAMSKRRGRLPKAEPSRAAEVFDDKFGQAVQRAAGVKLDKAKVDAEYKAAMDRVTLLYAEETILGGEAFPAKIADVAQPEEQLTRNQQAAGSIKDDAWVTKISNVNENIVDSGCVDGERRGSLNTGRVLSVEVEMVSKSTTEIPQQKSIIGSGAGVSSDETMNSQNVKFSVIPAMRPNPRRQDGHLSGTEHKAPMTSTDADVRSALPQTETANSLGSGNEQHGPKPRSADGLGEYALSMTKPRLNEAVEHLEAILMLIQGFNGNHELIKGWCRECDGNYLHGQESCLCPCHPARDFLVAVKKELAQPRL